MVKCSSSLAAQWDNLGHTKAEFPLTNMLVNSLSTVYPFFFFFHPSLASVSWNHWSICPWIHVSRSLDIQIMRICNSTHNSELPQFKIVATCQLKQQQISRCWKRHTQIPLGSTRSGKNLSLRQYPVASNVEVVMVEREWKLDIIHCCLLLCSFLPPAY